MRKYAICLILLVAGWHASLAQVDESTQSTVEPVPAPPGKQTGAQPQAPAQTDERPDQEPETTVFNPTEEISEDLPVPFPVDI